MIVLSLLSNWYMGLVTRKMRRNMLIWYMISIIRIIIRQILSKSLIRDR